MGGPASWPFREREGRFEVVAIVACQELVAAMALAPVAAGLVDGGVRAGISTRIRWRFVLA
jgi:hypothetical protein